MDEGVLRAKEGNFAFIGESVSLDLAVARHCELVRAHEVIGMRGYSIAATTGEVAHFKAALNIMMGNKICKIFKCYKFHKIC